MKAEARKQVTTNEESSQLTETPTIEEVNQSYMYISPTDPLHTIYEGETPTETQSTAIEQDIESTNKRHFKMWS